MNSPRLIFLAGPNGAGKSTFYETYLKTSGLYFVNADRFTAALAIPNTEARSVADAIRSKLLAERQSFITETVFSDPVGAKLQFLRDAIAHGYHVTLHFIGLSSPQLSEARVFQRVLAGGHDVPADRLERRYHQSLKNLSTAMAFIPEIQVFDNSTSRPPYQLVLSIVNGHRQFEASPLPSWLSQVLKP